MSLSYGIANIGKVNFVLYILSIQIGNLFRLNIFSLMKLTTKRTVLFLLFCSSNHTPTPQPCTYSHHPHPHAPFFVSRYTFVRFAVDPALDMAKRTLVAGMLARTSSLFP